MWSIALPQLLYHPWYRDSNLRERKGFPWAQPTAWRAGFIQPELLEDMGSAVYVDHCYRKTVEESSILEGTSKLETRMEQMMNLNVDWFMQTLLDHKDRMSMYSSLEVRVPFCDPRIAEYLYMVPWEFKDHNGYEKRLLREAMRGILPDEVLCPPRTGALFYTDCILLVSHGGQRQGLISNRQGKANRAWSKCMK